MKLREPEEAVGEDNGIFGCISEKRQSTAHSTAGEDMDERNIP